MGYTSQSTYQKCLIQFCFISYFNFYVLKPDVFITGTVRMFTINQLFCSLQLGNTRVKKKQQVRRSSLTFTSWDIVKLLCSYYCIDTDEQLPWLHTSLLHKLNAYRIISYLEKYTFHISRRSINSSNTREAIAVACCTGSELRSHCAGEHTVRGYKQIDRGTL